MLQLYVGSCSPAETSTHGCACSHACRWLRGALAPITNDRACPVPLQSKAPVCVAPSLLPEPPHKVHMRCGPPALTTTSYLGAAASELLLEDEGCDAPGLGARLSVEMRCENLSPFLSDAELEGETEEAGTSTVEVAVDAAGGVGKPAGKGGMPGMPPAAPNGEAAAPGLPIAPVICFIACMCGGAAGTSACIWAHNTCRRVCTVACSRALETSCPFRPAPCESLHHYAY